MDAEPDTSEPRRRGIAGWRAVESDSAARWTMWIAWPIGVLIVIVIGRNQWFARDDWAFLFTRERLHETAGLDAMLLEPQDGHWMTWPILVFRALYQPRRHALVRFRTCSCCGRPMSASSCSPTAGCGGSASRRGSRR